MYSESWCLSLWKDGRRAVSSIHGIRSPVEIIINCSNSGGLRRAIKHFVGKIMKISRNDPCPCGSGKKYKQCCLKNESKDECSLIRERVAAEEYPSDLADVLCNLVQYIHRKGWMGACHSSTAILYVALSEMGYKPEICIGEVGCPWLNPFDHSWIVLDGKVIDIAVIMTLLGGRPVSDAIVFDKNIRTGEQYYFEYGIETGLGLDTETQVVLQYQFGEYMDAFPDEVNGLWGVVDIITDHKYDINDLRNKYRDVKRTLVKNRLGDRSQSESQTGHWFYF